MANKKMLCVESVLALFAAHSAFAETAHETITHANGASEHAHLFAEATDLQFDAYNHLIDEANEAAEAVNFAGERKS